MVHVHGHLVNPHLCTAISEVPCILTLDAFKVLVRTVMGCNVCAGHPDANFVKMAEDRKGKFLSPNKDLVSYLDNCSVKKDGIRYHCTVRHAKCELLVQEFICGECHNYHSNLRAMYSSYTKKRSTVTSNRTNITLPAFTTEKSENVENEVSTA